MQDGSKKTPALAGLVFAPLFFAAMPLIFIPTAEWIAVSRNGSELILWYSMLFVFPTLFAVPVFFVALIGLAFRQFRRTSASLALCAAAFVVAVLLSLKIGESIRIRAFLKLTKRSKPLIEAVRAFEQKVGRPPESLQALVPEFMPSIPSTGMGAYPEYRYSTNATNYYGNPWVLTIFTPSGGVNFDQFLYFPMTNYPRRAYGGWLQRVGDWAYVHE